MIFPDCCGVAWTLESVSLELTLVDLRANVS
jgi:hypothetical protein